jgi:integrase/recombinase XerD
MPRLKKRLPHAVLNEEEVERVLLQPELRDPLGVRDRAILETFLKLYNVDHLRGTLSIWLGKGKKDRIVPIGDASRGNARKEKAREHERSDARRRIAASESAGRAGRGSGRRIRVERRGAGK